MQRSPLNPNFKRLLLYLLPPPIITAILWATSIGPVSDVSAFLALILLYAPWIAYHNWRRDRQQPLPLFGMMYATYWAYFALPLFWGDHSSPAGRRAILLESTIDGTMLLAVVAVLAQWAGGRAASSLKFTPSISLGNPRTRKHWRHVYVLMSLRLLGPFVGGGGDARQIILLVTDFVPLVAFALLFRKFLDGYSTSFEKGLMAIFVVVNVFIGVSSGWIGAVIGLFIIIGLLYLQSRGRMPKLAIAVIVVYMLFFQVGKNDFRTHYWGGGSNSSTAIERVTAWTSFSMQRWGQFFDRPSSRELQGLVSPTINRLSLLRMAGIAVEQTPKVVPYQGFQLYRYMLVTLIPRFVWPEKPTFNEANQFFQVAYGLTRPDQLEFTSISVGIAAESYIGFGWAGVVGVMFLLGFILFFFNAVFLNPKTPMILMAIGVAMLPQLVEVGSQFVQYLGGILQHIFLAYVMFLPIIGQGRRAPRNTLDYGRSQLGPNSAVSLNRHE